MTRNRNTLRFDKRNDGGTVSHENWAEVKVVDCKMPNFDVYSLSTMRLGIHSSSIEDVKIRQTATESFVVESSKIDQLDVAATSVCMMSVRESTISGGLWKYVSASETALTAVQFKEVRFLEVSLGRVTPLSAAFNGCSFTGCEIKNIAISPCDYGTNGFYGCEFHNTVFMNCDLQHMSFVSGLERSGTLPQFFRCYLHGVSFVEGWKLGKCDEFRPINVQQEIGNDVYTIVAPHRVHSMRTSQVMSYTAARRATPNIYLDQLRTLHSRVKMLYTRT